MGRVCGVKVSGEGERFEYAGGASGVCSCWGLVRWYKFANKQGNSLSHLYHSRRSLKG